MRTVVGLLSDTTPERPPVVVGNGSSIVGSFLGTTIDSSAFVVRFNHWWKSATTFYHDCGSKCDLHVVAVGGDVRAAFGWVVVRPGDPLVRRGVPHPCVPSWRLGPRGHFASSGLVVVVSLLAYVPKVAIVGFDHGASGHYWQSHHGHSKNHDWEEERKMFGKLEQDGKVVRL